MLRVAKQQSLRASPSTVMTANDQGSGLPSAIADELGDAIYRSAHEKARKDAVEAVVLRHPSFAEPIRAMAAEWAKQAAAPETPLPEPFGPYRFAARLGRGGFGDVYLAEQREPVRRKVALKVLKRGMDSEAILRRFAREQQALARMDHEAVAKFYDAGSTPGGHPYFAMEYVEGQPIADYCEAERLSLRERLLLFVQVCRGVQHAHQRGVVHRDLKPSNVLVARRGDAHAPKLIDFGIARALEDDLDGFTRTSGESALGTPAYMAPEQSDPGMGQVDTRTDVYALGALLCEMLTGSSPLAHAIANAKSDDSLRQGLRDAEPLRPSLIEPKKGRVDSAFRRALRGDLDWIVLMAMRKEQDLRYASAAELALDIERHLADEPVSAGPPTLGYRGRKFLRKYRTQVIAAGLVLVTALGGALVALDYAGLASQRAEDNAKLAQSESKAKVEAQSRAEEAKANAEKFEGKVREFNLLAGVIVERRARETEPKLVPAWPSNLEGLQRWIDGDFASLQAQATVIDTAIRSLREKALPWTEADRERHRREHPRHGEWRALGRRAAWLQREMELVGKPAPVAELTDAERQLDYESLNEEAWIRIAPNIRRTVYGEEAKGLAFARLALEKGAKGPALADLLDSLAWGFVANGQDDDARTAAMRMVDACPDSERSAFEDRRRLIESTVAERAEQLAKAKSEADAVDREIEQSRSWFFGNAPDEEAAEFLHTALCELRDRSVELSRNQAVRIRARLRWAQWLRDGLSTKNPKAALSWDDVRKSVAANPRYRGQRIELADADVQDLVPIGENPATGLFEFYHLPSAWDGAQDPWSIAIPRHRADGSLEGGPELGIVFVLVPGGIVRIGAQGMDPSLPLYDEEHDPRSAVHQVDLSPFFAARHEVTQAQWSRLWTGAEAMRNPSNWGAGGQYGSQHLSEADVLPPLTNDNPVENVDWNSAQQMLDAYGLRLPTCAQWEHAGRAGSLHPWHTGPQARSLCGAANVLDEFGQKAVPQWGKGEPWNDGHIVHSRVGSFPANAFGLHDVHGNVFEWCLDAKAEELDASRRPDDGLIVTRSNSARYLRGGTYAFRATAARFGYLSANSPAFRDSKIGFRASRPLRPSTASGFR